MKKIIMLLSIILLCSTVQASHYCYDHSCSDHFVCNTNSNCTTIRGDGFAHVSCPANETVYSQIYFAAGGNTKRWIGSGNGFMYWYYIYSLSQHAPFDFVTYQPPPYDTSVYGCVGLSVPAGGSITLYYFSSGGGEVISTISGNRYCPSLTILYILNGGSYEKIDQSYTSTYSFDIMEGYDYLIVFDAYNFYYFSADGSDIVKNYDNCEDQGDPGEPVDPDDPDNPNPDPVDTYIRLFFMDNCNNLIRETAGTHYSDTDLWEQAFYAPLGFFDIDFENQDYLELWVDSGIGTLYYNISNPKCAGFLTYVILNPTISWNNNIFVQDGNTSLPIENALVFFSQDCIINPDTTPPRYKYTDVNGIVNFCQCELDSFSLGVSAINYQSFSDNSISSISLNAFNLEQTILVKLYPLDDAENETEYNYTDYNTWIKFKDTDGNYTSTILDTDNYIDLYYYNNNSEEGAMTLKFQKYNIGTGITDLLSWNIPIDTEGYKRILKSNYTDISYLYIGYLYNYAIDGWDRTEYLNVRNETIEIDLDYENLTAFTWFLNKNPESSIDYREDINIVAYANSSYVGLLNISLELYDNTTYTDHINLTWADFITADLVWYYEWNPDHSYINGHNYTVRMHGYDYYLLDIDYVNAVDYRKNKLTIYVKDNLGNNLINSFVFLDGYGSLSTSDSYFNSYEGLDDGFYRYKASKSGYDPSGWEDITLSGEDGDVICVLTITSGEGAKNQPIKTSDNELKNLYIMLMSFLLIFILFGGFMYVTK